MNLQKKNKFKKPAKKTILISLLTVVVLLTTVYFVGVNFYKDHFYNHTIINGIDCSNKSLKDSVILLKAKADSYVLTLKERNDVTEHIQGSHINLQVSFGQQLQALLQSQRSTHWLSMNRKKQSFEFTKSVAYDEKKLKKQLQNLNCFKEEFIIEPEDAKISAYSDSGYSIVKEVSGTRLDERLVMENIKEAIVNFDDVVDLEKKDCYIEPKILSDNAKLKLKLDTLNLYTSTRLTYQFGDKTEVLDGSIIHKWLSIDGDKITLDKDKVKEYVDYIGKNYNSFGRTRLFKTSYNKTVKVRGGDYGWWLNRVAEQSEIIEAIYQGAQTIKTPNYYQTAMQYGSDDIGNTYVEVNLSAQHLFFYVDGKLLIESDFVSGSVIRDHMTAVGTYGITYKEKGATLVGEDYETPVKYWMPFNGNIGLHDANWRSDFGGDIFLTNGSHGCINLPPNVAEVIFENIKKGTPVICYELPGTESYDKKKYQNLMKINEKKREAKKKALEKKNL